MRHAFASCALGAIAFALVGFVPLQHEVSIGRGMFVSMNVQGVSGVAETMSVVQVRGVVPVSAYRRDPDASRVASRGVIASWLRAVPHKTANSARPNTKPNDTRRREAAGSGRGSVLVGMRAFPTGGAAA